MLEFYKKNLKFLLAISIASTGIVIFCIQQFNVVDVLQPKHKSVLPWQLVTFTDTDKGGSSTISVNDVGESLDYTYVLTREIKFPYVTALMAFDQPLNATQFADLSRYSEATFNMQCFPQNTLSVHLHSFDPQVTDPGNFSTYRISEVHASCDKDWSAIKIDLRFMDVPMWWQQEHNVEITDKKYWLDKVIAFSIDASWRGPVNTPANVKISNFSLHGQDWRYVWWGAGLLLVLWGAYVVWLSKNYSLYLTAALKQKLSMDRPAIAYQQLSIERHKDKDKGRILHFMATEYANPDLGLDMAVEKLNLNRNKINEVLKEEVGLTFSAYLNKLRLVEAARLLAASGDLVSIAEVAYGVGYNNISWFNKLFKKEYGCTPKAFKNLMNGKTSAI